MLKELKYELELSIEKTIRGMVQIEGEMVVPGKFFCEYIKKLNNEQIELNVDDKNVLSIKYTDSVGKIQCLNATEFPQTVPGFCPNDQVLHLKGNSCPSF